MGDFRFEQDLVRALPARGTTLAAMPRDVESRLEVIAGHPDVDAARETLEKAFAAPSWSGAPLWLHGDPHPANVTVRDGMLAGVIDFGEMCAGDPTSDLAAAWMLLPAGTANRFFDAYAHTDEATITRPAAGPSCGPSA